MYLSKVTSMYLSKVTSLYYQKSPPHFDFWNPFAVNFASRSLFFSRHPSGLSVPPPSCQQMIINLREIGNFRKIPPHVVKISIPPRDIAAKVNGDRFDNGFFPRRKKGWKRGLSSDGCKLHALDEVLSNLGLAMSIFVFVFVSDSKPVVTCMLWMKLSNL